MQPIPDIRNTFQLEDIRQEILMVLKAMGRGAQTQAGYAMGVDKFEMSRKLKSKTVARFFDWQQLGRLNTFVSENYKTTPPAWPFLTFRDWAALKSAILTGDR